MSNAKGDTMEPKDQGAFCYYSSLATMLLTITEGKARMGIQFSTK